MSLKIALCLFSTALIILLNTFVISSSFNVDSELLNVKEYAIDFFDLSILSPIYKSNTSISHIQQLKSNHSIDYKKKNNSNDNSKDKI